MPNPIDTHGTSPNEASWSVINAKYELHLSDESPGIHLPRAHAKKSHSPRPSASATATEYQGSRQANIADPDIIPYPLKIGKKAASWSPGVGDMHKKKSKNKHPLSTTAPHSGQLTVEMVLEQQLFQVRAQITELRMSLSLCESKLSQMADELLEIKSDPTPSHNHDKPQHPITAPAPAPDYNHLTTLSSVNATGVSAQRKRSKKTSAI